VSREGGLPRLLGVARWRETRQAASLREFVYYGKGRHEVGLESYRNHQKLLRRHQRMRDGMDREGDAVLHSDFAHQFCDVSFHGALFDSEG